MNMAKMVAKKAPAAKPAAKAPVKKAPAAAKAPAKKAPAAKAAPAPAKPLKVTAEKGKTVTQSALLQVIADQNGMSRADAKRFVDSYIDIVKAHVQKGAKVKLGDIGTISIRERKARMGRNPQTGEAVKIKASKKLAFRQSTTMRDALAKK
jgi:DNA-binding protein HU-beta